MWISGRTLEGHTDIRCMCRWTGVSRFEGCSTSLDKFSESPNHYDTPTTKHQHISKSSQDAITIKSHWQISWGWAKGENLKWTTSNNFRELEGEEREVKTFALSRLLPREESSYYTDRQESHRWTQQTQGLPPNPTCRKAAPELTE